MALGVILSLSKTGTPTAFRLFKRGINETTKGAYLFDDRAAKLVMAAYERQGVELPIDLEHDSLSEDARAQRSDAGDALGWFQLAVRNGELWAVNVRFNSEGSRRLSAKSQRYISPAFKVEPADNGERVIELVNAALVSMPATHNAPALVAARRGKLGRTTSRVVPVRLTNRQARDLGVQAKRAGTTPSGLLRGLAELAMARGDAATARLRSLLRLPKGAPRERVIAAIAGIVPANGDRATMTRLDAIERSAARLARRLGESPKLVRK